MRPECKYGYPIAQLDDLFGKDVTDRYIKWTTEPPVICRGEHCDLPHGKVAYAYDVLRWTDQEPLLWKTRTDGRFGIVHPARYIRVHDPELCDGRPCVVHNPSNHHMKSWETIYRTDKGIVERICPHGIGHPDPDDATYRRLSGRPDDTTHGCDGCCQWSK